MLLNEFGMKSQRWKSSSGPWLRWSRYDWSRGKIAKSLPALSTVAMARLQVCRDYLGRLQAWERCM